MAKWYNILLLTPDKLQEKTANQVGVVLWEKGQFKLRTQVKGEYQMQIQYITDIKGHKTNVIVPYKEWEHLMEEIQKQRMLLGIKKKLSQK